MGDEEADKIIAQWRASARAAGESETEWSADDEGPRRRLWRNVVLAVAGVLGAGAVAVLMLTGPGSAAPTEEYDRPSPAPPAAGSSTEAPARAAVPEGNDQPSPAPSAAGSPTQAAAPLLDDWFAVVAQADRVRGEAYSAADGAGLSAAFLPEGEAMAQEQDLLGRMREREVTAPGWSTRLVGVSPVTVDGALASLRVTDERAAYDLVGPDGTLTPVAAAPPMTWLVTVRRTGGSWLVERVERQASEPATSPPAQP